MKKHLALLNLFALLLSAVMHLLSYTSLLPQSIALVRESRPLVFLPANIGLVTWVFIYLSLLIYAVFQSRGDAQKYVESASFYFLFTCIGKITWTVLYVYGSMWMSSLALVMTLAALVMLYEKLNLRYISIKRTEYWLVRLPFSMFLGWVSVLLVVNIASALYDIGYQASFLGITADIWTIILVAFLMGLAALLQFKLDDSAFALTIAWGALTIFIRPFDTDLYSSLQHLQLGLVDIVAFMAFASLILLVGIRLIHSWRKNQKLLIA